MRTSWTAAGRSRCAAWSSQGIPGSVRCRRSACRVRRVLSEVQHCSVQRPTYAFVGVHGEGKRLRGEAHASTAFRTPSVFRSITHCMGYGIRSCRTQWLTAARVRPMLRAAWLCEPKCFTTCCGVTERIIGTELAPVSNSLPTQINLTMPRKGR